MREKKDHKKVKKVIAVIGTMSSGKGVFSKYLTKKYGFQHITMSNILRGIAESKGIKPTRKNLEKLQTKLRANNKAFLVDEVVKKIEQSKKKKFVIDGARHPIQVAKLKKMFNAKVIFVDANPEIRFERMKKRARPGDPTTLAEFKRLEVKENKIFNFNKTKKYADFKIINDGSEKELYKKVDKLIEKLN